MMVTLELVDTGFLWLESGTDAGSQQNRPDFEPGRLKINLPFLALAAAGFLALLPGALFFGAALFVADFLSTVFFRLLSLSWQRVSWQLAAFLFFPALPVPASSRILPGGHLR
ncbi:MAG: hypothetical protein R2864_08725 [Syntrophotaleaceae bacterium]